MILLDENIAEGQREALTNWKSSIKQIGFNVSAKGIKDSEIIPFLLTLTRPTLITRDKGLYRRQLCHHRYSIVVFDVHPNEVALYAIPFFHHKKFDTQSKRLGKIVRVSTGGMTAWTLSGQREIHVTW